MQRAGVLFKFEEHIKVVADIAGTARHIAALIHGDRTALAGAERAQVAAAGGKVAAAGADVMGALLTASCAARLDAFRLPAVRPEIVCVPDNCGRAAPAPRFTDEALRSWQNAARAVQAPCPGRCGTRPGECARCALRAAGVSDAQFEAYAAALQVFSGWVCAYLLARYERDVAAEGDAAPAADDGFLTVPDDSYTTALTRTVHHAKQSMLRVSGAGVHDALMRRAGSFYVALYARVCRPHATRRVDLMQMYLLASTGAEVVRMSGIVPAYMEDVPTRTMRLYVWARSTGNHARVPAEFATLATGVAARAAAWFEGARLSLAMALRDKAPIAAIGQDVIMMVAGLLQAPSAPASAI